MTTPNPEGPVSQMNDHPTTPAGDSLRERAARHLAALGDTPEQVAATLLARGRYGEQVSCGNCPVAVDLLHSTDLGLYSVLVDCSEASLYFGPSLDDVVYVDVPDQVGEFILAFDAGQFPQLLKADGAR